MEESKAAFLNAPLDFFPTGSNVADSILGLISKEYCAVPDDESKILLDNLPGGKQQNFYSLMRSII